MDVGYVELCRVCRVNASLTSQCLAVITASLWIKVAPLTDAY